MKSGRLEAFSDGVLAIIITVMVLELEAPNETTLEAIIALLPIFISYLGSFIYVSIYWNHHHHIFQMIESVNYKILWANLHLLFWISLIPFTTSWIGENHIDTLPVALYGFVLIMIGISFRILKNCIVRHHGKKSRVGQLCRIKRKDMFFLSAYISGVMLTFFNTYGGVSCFIIVILFQIFELKQLHNTI
jgi:uncharacterized membrane protein